MRGEHCLYSCVLASFQTFFRPKAEEKRWWKAKCLRQVTRLRHPSSSCSLFCSIKECLLHDNLMSELQFYIFIVLVTTKLHAPEGESRETRDERKKSIQLFPAPSGANSCLLQPGLFCRSRRENNNKNFCRRINCSLLGGGQVHNFSLA